MKPTDETLSFESQAAWLRWLRKSHASVAGVWLKLAKKGSGIASVDYPQALEAALIWGWIDGHKKPLDGEHWLQRFTPRGPKSRWSKVNCAKIEALMAAGKLEAPGLAAVEAAKADGRWADAYSSPKHARIPDDLIKAFEPYPEARAFFEAASSANRYSFLYRIDTAKKPATRQRHVARTVEMCRKGETYP